MGTLTLCSNHILKLRGTADIRLIFKQEMLDISSTSEKLSVASVQVGLTESDYIILPHPNMVVFITSFINYSVDHINQHLGAVYIYIHVQN